MGDKGGGGTDVGPDGEDLGFVGGGGGYFYDGSSCEN